MSSTQPRALTTKQERRLIMYLDMQFLEVSRGFKKRYVCLRHGAWWLTQSAMQGYELDHAADA